MKSAEYYICGVVSGAENNGAIDLILSRFISPQPVSENGHFLKNCDFVVGSENKS